MKAIVVQAHGGPEVMVVSDADQPDPKIGEVCVNIEAAGVNPVDTYLRAGMYPVLPELPYTPGMDGAGTIASIGEGVEKWAVGDRVYIAKCVSGTYAECAVCNQNDVYPLPDNITFEQGAAVGVPGAAAWRSLFLRGEAKPGDRVLIHGASGSVGLFAIQLAKLAGLKVYGTAGTQAGRTLVCKYGALDTFNHGDDKYRESLMALTKGEGFDLILEMLANVNLEKDLEMLAPRGKVIIVGSRGRIEIDPRLTMGKETDIRGMSLFNATADENNRMHAALGAAMAAGGVIPVVNNVLPLEAAPQAHEQVLKDGNLGKIVLRP